MNEDSEPTLPFLGIGINMKNINAAKDRIDGARQTPFERCLVSEKWSSLGEKKILVQL